MAYRIISTACSRRLDKVLLTSLGKVNLSQNLKVNLAKLVKILFCLISQFSISFHS